MAISVSMSVSENAASGQPCLVFRRQGELIEGRLGAGLAGWEEVECEYRRTACDETRRCKRPSSRVRGPTMMSAPSCVARPIRFGLCRYPQCRRR